MTFLPVSIRPDALSLGMGRNGRLLIGYCCAIRVGQGNTRVALVGFGWNWSGSSTSYYYLLLGDGCNFILRSNFSLVGLESRLCFNNAMQCNACYWHLTHLSPKSQVFKGFCCYVGLTKTWMRQRLGVFLVFLCLHVTPQHPQLRLLHQAER